MLINFVEFEVQKPVSLEKFLVHNHRERVDLFDCYERPSHAKMDIYSDWLEWCLNTEGMSFPTITSYNTSQFTIGATYTDPETLKHYIIEITKKHNRVYPVNED